MHRRDFLAAAAAAAVLPQAAQAQGLPATPRQILGPFYPRSKPSDSDADLTRVAGRSARAAGQVIRLSGRVLDTRGRALPGARVELWQADSGGRYLHPDEPNLEQFDRDFQGYATLVADRAGRFAVTSIRPGSYSTGGRLRTPHVHFKVTAPSARLVTQMYFPGEPLNASDRILRRSDEGGARLVARRLDGEGAGAQLLGWDIVLPAA